MKRTERTFTDIETNEVFRLYVDGESYALISDGSERYAKGTEVNSWHLAAHTPMHIKINNEKVIHLDRGTFYTLKENEKVTHKKYPAFQKFTKV